MKAILKLTNPSGPVIINGVRFEANVLGNRSTHADSMAYTCLKWAEEDKKALESACPNINVKIIRYEDKLDKCKG